MRSFAAIGIGALVAMILGVSPAGADVVGDDDNDQYVGTGAVLLPGGVAPSAQQSAAECEDCRWRLTNPCTSFTSTVCAPIPAFCTDPQVPKRVWFARGDDPWRDIGVICVGSSGLLTLAKARAAIQDEFRESLPSLNPKAQPKQGILPRIPVIFRSGQTPPGASVHYLLGRRFVLDPTPRWRWRFGDGTVMNTTKPGSKWPKTDIAHPYASAGTRTVRVRTTWTATFTVDGLGPFPVEETITQNDTVDIEVGEARAVLVP